MFQPACRITAISTQHLHVGLKQVPSFLCERSHALFFALLQQQSWARHVCVMDEPDGALTSTICKPVFDLHV